MESEQRLDFADRLRANPTIYEARLWRRLKNGYRGVNFEQQIVIAGYIVDFYCHAAKVAIELDGKQHDPVRDSHRDQQILHKGVKVMRFPNPRNYVELNDIIFKVWAEVRYRKKLWQK